MEAHATQNVCLMNRFDRLLTWWPDIVARLMRMGVAGVGAASVISVILPAVLQ